MHIWDLWNEKINNHDRWNSKKINKTWEQSHQLTDYFKGSPIKQVSKIPTFPLAPASIRLRTMARSHENRHLWRVKNSPLHPSKHARKTDFTLALQSPWSSFAIYLSLFVMRRFSLELELLACGKGIPSSSYFPTSLSHWTIKQLILVVIAQGSSLSSPLLLSLQFNLLKSQIRSSHNLD